MIKIIIEYFTAIDEFNDLWKLWPRLCGYFENNLGWGNLASSTVSLLVTLAIIFLPAIILIAIIKALWNKFKNL